MGQKVQTLADLLRPGLGGVVVGINPSPVSVAAGHYYQGNLGQAFFRRLEKAGVIAPGEGPEDDRAFESGLGFTDLVKRPTARADGLTAEEREHGRAVLEEKLRRFRVPRVIFTFKASAVELLGPFGGHGLRPGRPLGEAEVFVMPGPMAPRADVDHALDELRAWWSHDLDDRRG
jgi:TDG/mug DNA glycosylase family protein